MRAADAAAHAMVNRIAARLATVGRRLDWSAAQLLDRSDALPLTSPGLVSPNGSCRLLRARDGWVAANLARADDIDLLPAWIGCRAEVPPWPALAGAAAQEDAAAFVARGAELGLAVARLGEARAALPCSIAMGASRSRAPGQPLRVIDLSALWAGPLCGAMLAAAGHVVTKIESSARPDPVAHTTPLLDARLNGGKARHAIPAFAADTVVPLVMNADILITSARPRAFAGIDLPPERLFAINPGLIWVAITGHGWTGDQANRTGFGDDAAVAGGLVDWTDGAPRFAGDALADPLTGLAAALAVFDAVATGGGCLIDAAMAPVAASIAMAICPAS